MNNIIIIEDDIKFAEQLKSYLETNYVNIEYSHFQAIEIVSCNYIDYIDKKSFDPQIKNLYILDIGLESNINGLDIAVKIRRYDPDSYLLFLTSRLELMGQVLNFNLKPINFIFKGDPLIYEKLDSSMKQIIYELGIVNRNSFALKFLQFQYRNSYYKITLSKILYIETDTVKRRLDIYTEKDCFHSNLKLNKLMDTLPNNFILIFRSIIVNIKFVSKIISKNGYYYVVLNNEKYLPISKKFLNTALEAFENEAL